MFFHPMIIAIFEKDAQLSTSSFKIRRAHKMNQDINIQNQDIFPFFQDNWNDLRYISNEQH